MIFSPIQAIPLPDGYTAFDILDESVDSINILAENQQKEKYSLRIFQSPDFLKQANEWQAELSHIPKDRFVRFDFFMLGSDHYCASRHFHSRTLASVLFVNQTLYEDQKHAVCLQIVDICSLIPPKSHIPLFPSRILLLDDLWIQLADLYPPNPVDDEAVAFNWYTGDRSTTTLACKIIQQIWNIDEQTSVKYFNDYKSQSGICPQWAHNFCLSFHRSEDISGIPPTICFDYYRARLLKKEPTVVCHSLIKICDLIPSLSDQLIRARLIPIIEQLWTIPNDIVQALVFCIIVQILGRMPIPSIKISNRLFDMAFSSDTCSRFCLFALLHKVKDLNALGISQKHIIALLSSAQPNEQDAFACHFCEFCNQVKAKTPIIQIIDVLNPSDVLLNSLMGVSPLLFNSDSIIAKMGYQIFTLSQLRFLVYISLYATPQMLFKFDLQQTLSFGPFSCLAVTLLDRLHQRLNPVDFSLLCPKVQVSTSSLVSPTPSDDTLLDELSLGISQSVFKEIPPVITPKARKKWSGRPSALQVEEISDAQFSIDGSLLITGGQKLKFFQNDAMAGFLPNLSPSAFSIPTGAIMSIAAIPDYLVYGTNQNRVTIHNLQTNSVSSEKILSSTPIVLKRFNESELVLVSATDGSILSIYKGVLENRFEIRKGAGSPISISSIPDSYKYMIGTESGTVILYDMRMQCPIKRARPSDLPAKVSSMGPNEVCITCGPYAAILDSELTKINRGYSIPPLHVVESCCIDGMLITAQSDFSIFGWGESYATNLTDGTRNKTEKSSIYYSAPCPQVQSLHEAPIIFLRPSVSSTSVLSCDKLGKLCIWPLG